MNTIHDLIHTNYLMAAGRIGLCCLLLPLLWGLAVLLYLDNPENVIVSAVLACLGIPLLWYAFTVPTSLRIGEQLTVSYLLGSRTYSREEIEKIEYTTVGTRFTLKHFIHEHSQRTKQIPMGLITPRNGRRILFRADVRQVEAIKNRFTESHSDQQGDSLSVECPGS